MKLEQQVVSLELSKELKEAGYSQEGLWWWVICKDLEYSLWSYRKLTVPKKSMGFVAPTVAELGERLPCKIDIHKKMGYSNTFPKYTYLETTKLESEWRSEYGYFHSEYADTEANARAKMWLYLKKEKLI